jgi:replication factor C subunit 1
MGEKRKAGEPPLEGETFVFTGTFSVGREEMQARARMLGGRVTTAPSSKTTFFVVGRDPGETKVKRARSLGVKMIEEGEFMKMVSVDREGSGTYDMRGAGGRGDKTPWVEKYRPKSLREFVGHKVQIEALRKVMDGSAQERAVVLYGPSGTGKTLSVYLLAKELGITIIEVNSAQQRSKGLVKEMRELSGQGLSRRVLLVDEVDQMSMQDRGGIAELAILARESKIPVVFTANDKNDQKMRSLAFREIVFPKVDQRNALMFVKRMLQSEGITIPDGVLIQILIKCNNDLRYVTNTLQYLSKKGEISDEDIRAIAKSGTEESPFDLTREIFREETAAKKMDVFFRDPSIVPLMVFENYRGAKMTLGEAAGSADLLSFSDVVEKRIRQESEWTLLPSQGVFVVASIMNKRLSSRIEFTSVLGNLSKTKKNSGILRKVQAHCKTGGIFGASFHVFIEKMARKLFAGDTSWAVDVLAKMRMDKADIDVLMELFASGVSIPSKTKARFTREYKSLNIRCFPVCNENTEAAVQREGP